MELKQENDSTLSQLQFACFDLKTILKASADTEEDLGTLNKKFDALKDSLLKASRSVAPLQSLAMATKALDTRINRAVSPALSLLESFKISETLQQKLIEISTVLSNEDNGERRLKKLLKYVDCVDQLTATINTISLDGEPVIQKLQEVVEFLSRTKAADQYRTMRLTETLTTLKALYEAEVDAIRFDGLLDQSLLNLQDEYESILQRLVHRNIGQSKGEENDDDGKVSQLGTESEVEILRRISETLAANDCLDICIDIFVKVRYRRAAKALMRLNPEYLKTFTPEEIDEMEWESLETAITLWIQHFELALKTVLLLEKDLCNQVLANIMDGQIWPECFVKIADKIMAVFFRFGEGVARSNKEPQKLFKLLDMFDSLEKLKTEFAEVFEGEAGSDICLRFRELEKLLIHSSSKVFWEFGLQIEGNQDGFPPPPDGSVPKLVRYTINYLKYLAADKYSAPMAKVLKTEQIWKRGFLSEPEPEENLFKDAVLNIMEALQRNIESKRSRCRDKILPHIFAMNTYWYIYMRSRNSELGKLLGEPWMKKCKTVAEESAYLYQKQAWVPLVRLLEMEEPMRVEKEAMATVVKRKMEAFTKEFDEISQKHRSAYSIPDIDLRDQVREAIVKLVVPAYTEFLDAYSAFLMGKSYVSPETIEGMVGQVLDGRDLADDGKLTVRRRDSRDLTVGRNSPQVDSRARDFQRARFNTSNS